MGIESVAVVGSGLMGRGIAYAAARGGFCTALNDVSGPAREQALVQIRPASLLVQNVKGGRLGKKVGRGVYEYDRR